jgi:hypothetical protein
VIAQAAYLGNNKTDLEIVKTADSQTKIILKIFSHLLNYFNEFYTCRHLNIDRRFKSHYKSQTEDNLSSSVMLKKILRRKS